VDWGNPSTKGLVFAWNGSNLSQDLSNNSSSFSVSNSVSGLTIQQGKAVRATNATGRLNFNNQRANVLGAITVAYAGIITSYSLDAGGVSKSGLANGATNNPFDSFIKQPDGFVRLVRANSTKYRSQRSSIPVPLNTPFVVIAYNDGQMQNLSSFFINGTRTGTVDEITISPGDGVGSPTSNSQPVYLLNRGDNATPFQNGGLVWACVWERILTDSEIKSISANPWQIFRKRQSTWIPAANEPLITTISPLPIGLHNCNISVNVLQPTKATVTLLDNNMQAVGSTVINVVPGTIDYVVPISISGVATRMLLQLS
jgi:hypothetical protein